MATHEIRFDDGQAYEQRMGVWSRLAGHIFLDWLALRPGLAWVDIGCGTGAFTELIVELCRPAEVQGVDPSEAQLAFARSRPAARVVKFRKGDAMALPFSENTFDAAVTALVIFFVSGAGLHDAPQSVTARFLTEGVAVDRFAAALSGLLAGTQLTRPCLRGRG